jgi:hypothetical protein
LRQTKSRGGNPGLDGIETNTIELNYGLRRCWSNEHSRDPDDVHSSRGGLDGQSIFEIFIWLVRALQ